MAKSPIGFANGLSYAIRGARFVYFQHPGLVRYWSFPILVTGLAIVSVFYGVGTLSDDLGNAMWSVFPESWENTTGFWGVVLTALRWLLQLVSGILITLAGLVLVVVISSIVAAPFNDALSEAVERILTGEAAPPFSFKRMVGDVVRTVRIEALKVLIYAGVVGPLFLVSLFVPGLGQVISLVAFALTALYLGLDYIDWPAARRDWSVSDRVSFVRQQLAAIAGFGTGVWVLLFIPLINLFFMPAAVAGGTMLFVAMNPAIGPKTG
jgi:CysZ protein